MKVLLLGSGGREHALAWKILQSAKIKKLYVAPGNAGTEEIAVNINLGITDFESQKEFIQKEGIDLLIVGPEVPLVEGIQDYFKKELPALKLIGPSKAGAELEGSKDFAKQFMNRHDVPTAAYRAFTKSTLEEGISFLSTLTPPYVLKADGLAAGKGVLILDNLQEAKSELTSMLQEKKFGEASSTVVIEEYLDGIEMSTFVLTDGMNYKVLPSAKDYKRIGEGDMGLNTGGMGAVSPVPFANEELNKKIEEKVIKRSILGLQKDQLDYKGFLFIGLMIVNNEPYVIEYNVRMGDPETEVVMPRIKSDLLEVLEACASGNLEKVEVEIDQEAATTVMLVSGGYPEQYENGKEITGLHQTSDCLLFHAGTKMLNGKLVSNGGRVIAVTGKGENFKDALAKSYRNAERIVFEGKYYRKDIGFDLMN